MLPASSRECLLPAPSSEDEEWLNPSTAIIREVPRTESMAMAHTIVDVAGRVAARVMLRAERTYRTAGPKIPAKARPPRVTAART